MTNDRFKRFVLPVLIACVAIAASIPPAFAARRKSLLGTPIGQLEQLITKDGFANVIVGVDLGEDWQPEGKLKKDEIIRQRNKITEKSEAVRKRHPNVQYVVGSALRTLPYFAAKIDREGLRQLLTDDEVASIEVNGNLQAALAESVVKIKATPSEVTPYSGSSQTVVVIDSGVNKNHPFFLNAAGTATRVIAEACFSSVLNFGDFELCPGANIDPNNPGETVKDTSSGSGMPCPSSADTGTPAQCPHGTRVAGIAVGRATTGISFSGVAPSASLVPIMVFSGTSSGVTVREHDVAEALEYVADELRTDSRLAGKPIAAVNISLALPGTNSGTHCDSEHTELAKAVDQLKSYGIPVVAGSGNNASSTAISIPACVEHVWAVGATTDGDAVAWYSNTAPILDLLAPGGDASQSAPYGVIPDEGIDTSDGSNSTIESYGTSFAAPHVTGAVALLRGKYPSESVDTLLARLQNTGVSITDNRPNPSVTKKRIRVADALSDTEAPTMPGSFAATTASDTSISLTWNASTDNVGVTGYRIERQSVFSNDESSWTFVVDTASLTYTNSNLARNLRFRFRIRAYDAGGNYSTSAYGEALTVNFPGTVVQDSTQILGSYLVELRRAADAWRVFAGQTRLFDSSYPAETGPIKAMYFSTTELVSGQDNSVLVVFNSARTSPSLGLSTFSYSGTAPAVDGPIKASFITELRNAMK